MNPSDQFVYPDHARSGEVAAGPVPVRGKADIPRGGPPGRAYRVEVVVLSVAERVTSYGNPCFFLKVRDAAGGVFFVVVWDRQWEGLRQRVGVGRPAALDVRPPASGQQAFTLA
jgi:hypothetical protein